MVARDGISIVVAQPIFDRELAPVLRAPGIHSAMPHRPILHSHPKRTVPIHSQRRDVTALIGRIIGELFDSKRRTPRQNTAHKRARQKAGGRTKPRKET